MKRNNLIASVLTSVLILSLLLTSCAVWRRKQTANLSGRETRAISLKSLQERLKLCQPKNSCTEEVLQLSGLKKMTGVIFDEQNRDLILLGETDPGSPPLHFDDFVVALRNAWRKYAPIDGNLRQYTSPGCSIDPNPQVMRALQTIKRQISSGPNTAGKMEKSIEDWARVCQNPQSVRVLGIPFKTHFAQVLVKADYDMKTLVDGSDSLDTPGFTSITDMMVNQARYDAERHQPDSLPPPDLNRFWFYPGENLYEEDQGVVIIKKCPVKLLTEQMYTRVNGESVGSGGTNSLAQTFAENFTLLYDKVARRRPVYIELENLFRFVALANIIKLKLVDSQTTFDLNYLLETYPVPENSVEQYLPGRFAVKEFEHVEDVSPTAQGLRKLWFPSCGGVDMAIEANPSAFNKNSSGQFGYFKKATINSRPSMNAPSWNISKDTADLLSSVNDNLMVQKRNLDNQESRTFIVEDKRSYYQVYDEATGQKYSGNEISKIVQELNAKLASDSRKTIYLSLKNFPSKDKVEAFAATCRMQQAKENTGILMRSLPEQDGAINPHESFFSLGTEFEKQSGVVEPIPEGNYKGWFRASFNFTVQVKDAIQRVTVRVYCKTAEHAQAFLEAVSRRFAAPHFHPQSVSDIINQTRREIKARYRLSDDEIDVHIENQVGNTYVVELMTPGMMGEGA
jgi:hypothetical protein